MFVSVWLLKIIIIIIILLVILGVSCIFNCSKTDIIIFFMIGILHNSIQIVA